MKNRGLSSEGVLIATLLCIAVVMATVAIIKKFNNATPTDTLAIENTKWAWDASVRQSCFNGFLYYVKGADDNILSPVFNNDRQPKRCDEELSKGTKVSCVERNFFGTDTLWDCNTATAQLGSIRCPAREAICAINVTENAALSVSIDGINWIAPILQKCPDTLLEKSCVMNSFRFARLEVTNAMTSDVEPTSCILYGYREDMGTFNRIRLDKDNRVLGDLRQFKNLAVGTIKYGPGFETLGVTVMFERKENKH